MDRLSLLIRAVIDYQLSLYPAVLDETLKKYETLFKAKCIVFLVVVLFLCFCWSRVISGMSRDVDNIRGVVLVLSLRRLEESAQLTKELRASGVLSLF